MFRRSLSPPTLRREPYGIDPAEVGRRSLRNLCLAYLMTLDDRRYPGGCLDAVSDRRQHDRCHRRPRLPGQPRGARAAEALDAFYRRWQERSAGGRQVVHPPGDLPPPRHPRRGEEAAAHPAFNIKNPNRVRVLIGAFAQGNPARFHDCRAATATAFSPTRSDRSRPPQPPGRRAPGPAPEPLAPLRRGPAALMQAELERIAAAPRAVSGRVRNRQQESGIEAGEMDRWQVSGIWILPASPFPESPSCWKGFNHEVLRKMRECS